MRSSLLFAVGLGLCSLVAASASAQRAATQRFTTNQRGDVLFVANSILTCSTANGATGSAQCAAGRTAANSTRINNDHEMVFIDVDAAADGTFASSSANLAVPAGAAVTWAGLYFDCTQEGGTAPPSPANRNRVKLRAPGGTYQTLTATVFDQLQVSGSNHFQGYVEVTNAVRAAGNGSYFVGDIQCNTGRTNAFGGWTIVVVTADSAQPTRNLTVFDAFQNYGNADLDVTVNGFLTPPMGTVNSRVGLVLYDGDRGNGDSVRLISGARNNLLGAAPGAGVLNPNDDFSNSTITRDAMNVTTRNPAYTNTLGYDSDFINTVDFLPNGATTATIRLRTTGENVGVGVITFATDIYAPDVSVQKTATDVNGGTLLRGDVLEYVIQARNPAVVAALGVTITDPIPAGTIYVPGSLQIAGAARTDAAGDDTANYDAGMNRVVFRIGMGANATVGGNVPAMGAPIELRFRVRIDPAAPGGEPIRNTAFADFQGSAGVVGPYTSDSDGDPAMPGSQPTVVTTGPVCGDGRVTAPETCDGGTRCTPQCRRGVDVTTPVDGATDSQLPAAIGGTADPGATVVVVIAGQTLMATADAAGAWTVTVPVRAATEGTYVVMATARDTLGTMTTDMGSVRVDRSTVVAFTAPAAGSTTSSARPTIRGTGEAGATVVVRVGGAVIGMATVQADGTWSLVPSADLADGPVMAMATATDPFGNTATATTTFTVDSTTTVTITAPAAGATVGATPTLTGTAESGATVEVRVGGMLLGTTMADAMGAWTFTPTTPLTPGSTTFDVTARDAAGNTATASRTVNVDANRVSIDTPAEGSSVRDSTPTISGTARPGATVTVSIDGAPVGMVMAGADGRWTFEPTLPLAQGAHTVTAAATENGTTVMDSNGFTVDSETRVDYRQPDGVTVGTSRPELSGTAEPGSQVAVTIDGAPVATVVADAEGNWTFVPASALSDAMHTVSVTATDAAGNTTTDTGSFRVDTRAPALELRTPGDQSTTRNTQPAIRGTTEPGLLVTVVIDGVTIGTVMADSDGNWSLVPGTPLAQGRHTVEASAADAAGSIATDRADFDIDSTAPRVAITAPATGARTADSTPSITGMAEPGATVEVFVDGARIATVVAAADGSWTATPTAPLGDGEHTVRAVARDAAGNTASAGSGFVVDTQTSVAITVPAEGGSVGNATPPIVGRAEPAARVEVRVDGTVIGTVTAGSDGSWTITPTTPLSAGPHTARATATDAVGNTASDDQTFTYDPSMLDTDGDGVPDVVECPATPCRDTDMDGTPDFQDPDDDGDGLPTILERPGMDTDSDLDGTPDYLDSDDDGDGVLTRDEAPSGTRRDTDSDGIPDDRDPDDDGDGLTTREERPMGADRDTDTDGTPDYRDPDDDGDTIPTARERADSMRPTPGGGTIGVDVNGNGAPNWLDTNADGDGQPDQQEGIGDADGDGIPNYLDPVDARPDGGVPPPPPPPPTDGGSRDGGVRDGSAQGDGAAADLGPPVGGLAGGACGCAVPGASGGGSAGWLALVALALFFARRRRGHAAGVLLLLASLGGAGAAQAQSVGLDQYRAAATPTDGFAVSRPDDLGHLRFGAQLHLDYALNPLVYETRSGDARTESSAVVAHQLVANVGVSLGLFDRLVVYAQLPVNLVLSGDTPPAGVRGADGTGLGDPLIGVRVRLFGERADVFALGAQAALSLPAARAAQSSSTYSGDLNVVFLPQLLGELRFAHDDTFRAGRVRVSLDVGARVRGGEPVSNLRVSSELTYGAALTVGLVDWLDAHAELYGASSFDGFGGRELSPLEAIGGLRAHPVCTGFAVGLAGGGGLSRGYGSPDLRGVLTVAWATPEARDCSPEPARVEPDVAPPTDDDRDHDGIPNATDACPDEPEDRDQFEDENGCPDPDNDHDGVLDVNDGAPLIPEDPDQFQDEDGVPDPDNDQDGVPDVSDGAPLDPEDRDGFADADGVPDPDNDQDTVLDGEDACPTAPGPRSATPEQNGCPANVRIEGDRIVILQRVEFATNRDVILPSSFPVLEDVRTTLGANPQITKLRIEGHTDDRGRDARNLDLSNRRAQSVMRWLVEHGVDAARLEAEGYGETRPLVPNRTSANRQRNRRVEFHILGAGASEDGTQLRIAE